MVYVDHWCVYFFVFILLLVTLAGFLSAVFIGTVVMFLLGVALFVFRRKHRKWYGVFEIVSGLILAGYTLARFVSFDLRVSFLDFLLTRDSLPTLLGLLSAVYIIVRGMDNIDEAIKISRDVQRCK